MVYTRIKRGKLFKGKGWQHWKWKWNKGKPVKWLILSTKTNTYTSKNDEKRIFLTYI